MFLQTTKQGQDLMLRHKRVIADVSFTGATPSTSISQSSDAPGAIFLSSEGIDNVTPDDPTANFGTIVNSSSGSAGTLLTANNYAILAGSAITNTGSSVITGNIGISPNGPSSVTGFPPGTFSGVEDAANAAAAQAKTDALAAYTALRAMTATSITANLNGQTLTPGVYTESSGTFNLAQSGNGTLTLNGAGTYVFNAASTLVTGAGGTPTITLSGGATLSNTNVFWTCGSSATINSGNTGTFVGNVIAQASVTDTLGGTVNGKLMALTGAVTLSAATTINGNASGGTSSLGVLIDGPKMFGGVVKKLFTLTVTETTSVAGSVTRILKGVSNTGITQQGNIAFTVSGASLNLTSQAVTYRCLVECAIDEQQHE